MNPPITLDHTREPLYRVVRSCAPDPLDVSHRQRRAGGYPLEHAGFPSPLLLLQRVGGSRRDARKFRIAGVELTDLQAEVRPQLVEISWSGRVVDVTSLEGVAAAGLRRYLPRRCP